MPTWKPVAGDRDETWTWIGDDGHALASVRREGGRWVAWSGAAGRVGDASSRREATAMLSYDRLTRSAQPSDAFRARRGEAQRVVAIRALGMDPEPEGAGYGDRYAADTGELLSWAREKKTSAQLQEEVERYLRETPRRVR